MGVLTLHTLDPPLSPPPTSISSIPLPKCIGQSRSFWDVSRRLKRCFKDATWMLHGCSKIVAEKYTQQYSALLNNVRVLNGCFKAASKSVQHTFSIVIYGCFKCV
jgi:hypothetical protein